MLNKALDIFEALAPKPIRQAVYLGILLWAGEMRFYWHWNSLFKPASALPYKDYVGLKNNQLALMRNEVEPRDFIYQALKVAKGCKNIVFQTSETQFIQFGLTERKYMFYFPVIGPFQAENLHNVIGALSLSGFKLQKMIESEYFPQKNEYILLEAEDVAMVKANFGRDRKNAAYTANYIIGKFFDDGLEDIRADAG